MDEECIVFIISVVIVCLYSTLFYVLRFMDFSFISYGPVGLKNTIILSYLISLVPPIVFLEPSETESRQLCNKQPFILTTSPWPKLIKS